MAWTRSDYHREARAAAVAESSPAWSDFTVRAWLRTCFDAGWRRILNADPLYRYTKLTVQPNADGFVPLATIDAALAPERRYRFLDTRVIRDAGLAAADDYVLEPKPLGPNVRFGVYGQAGPSCSAWVNHYPQNPEDLPTEDSVVTWPEGHEMALVNHVAGMILTRGGIESRAAADLLAVTDALYTDMIQAISNRSTAHASFLPTDAASTWLTGGDL